MPHAWRPSVVRRRCLPLMWLRRGAGEWRGLPVAVKTVVFQSREAEVAKSAVVSEAAIAAGLVHRNVVRTHHHDVVRVSAGRGAEQSIFKFILFQARAPSP